MWWRVTTLAIIQKLGDYKQALWQKRFFKSLWAKHKKKIIFHALLIQNFHNQKNTSSKIKTYLSRENSRDFHLTNFGEITCLCCEEKRTTSNDFVIVRFCEPGLQHYLPAKKREKARKKSLRFRVDFAICTTKLGEPYQICP